MKKKKSWSVSGVIGLFFILLFTTICVAPFVYMLIMSFTKSTTLMITWKDIILLIFHELSVCLWKSGFSRSCY